MPQTLPRCVLVGQDFGKAPEVLTFLLCLIKIIEVFQTLLDQTLLDHTLLDQTLLNQARTTEICTYCGNKDVLIYLVLV
jgi:hypothetical protein